MELTEEEKERKAKKDKAYEHKAKGNAAYKSKNFAEVPRLHVAHSQACACTLAPSTHLG